MKVIERQIGNHEFRIELEHPDQPQDRYFVDAQQVHRDGFMAAIALLSAEAPK